ncbi:arabinosyltransferase domain-containing protein [Pseudonocardia saturnea]
MITDAERRRPFVVVIALALLTGLLGIAAVLAPVDVDDPVLTWPRAGEAPASTVVPLSPYRPLELRADVPCAALGVDGDVLRTLPADVDATLGSGLVVASAGGRVTVDSSGQRLLDEPVSVACGLTVHADAAGTRVLRDGAVLADRPGLITPQVAELETAAEGRPEAAGLAVEIRTDARYQSTPSPLKTALLVAHGLALLALLVVAWRAWPGRGPGLVRPRPAPADAVVLVASAAWAVLGPVNIDDSWYALMARAAGASGYIGNYIYQFNVTENPFVLSQYAMQAWGQLGGWNLLWLRMLPLAYGLATYVLLRVLLATVLPRVRAAPWALAAAHLLWFCAYGITLRPETAIVVLSAAVLLLVELARRKESIGALAAATAVAALAMTVSPTALVAVAPLVLALPWFGRWLRDAAPVQRVAAGLLALAAASVVVPVGFGDASLGDVVESVRVHRWYYRQHPWYDEFVHYGALLEQSDQGAWGKRLPVLLTLAVIVLGLLAVGRTRGTGGPSARLLASSTLVTTLALASMALTPTKWVNHFGSVAAPATVLLAVALLRTPIPRRAGTGPTVIAVLATVFAAAVSFAGPNLWRPYADWGQPFGNHADVSTPVLISQTTPGIGPLELRNPVLWLAVAGLAILLARRGRRGLTPDRAVLAVAVAGGVALLLAAFTLAPVRQAPGASVASTNLAALTGDGCGFADAVTVLDGAGKALSASGGAAEVTGDAVAGTPPERVPTVGSTWHTDIADGTGTGSVTTPWYPVPDSAPTDAVVVATTGDLRTGQQIALEFRRGTDAATVAVDPAGLQAAWVDVTVVLDEVDLPDRPAEVRVLARDTIAGADTWFGVSAPRFAVARPVAELTAGAPVFADQVSAVFWPCADQIEIRDGLAEPPAYRLRAGDGLEGAIEGNAIFAPNGGTLVPISRTAQFVELPSRLPGGVPTLGWGHVERVVYDHPTGGYDLTVGTERRAGWTRLPTLRGEAYTGRGFIG